MPSYYAEESNYQFHISHDFGNWQLFYSGGYSETEIKSVEDYEKNAANADWTAALQTLADLGRRRWTQRHGCRPLPPVLVR